MRKRKERGAEKVISSGAIKGQLARDLQKGGLRERMCRSWSATAVILLWTRERRDGGGGVVEEVGGWTNSTTDGWGAQ